ncbi:hypothetical protein HKX48_009299 [Thoreauomyces humboldtii]|nr:hypothetical protein HKX48_009299 [Thoreauomyces humboldtii]
MGFIEPATQASEASVKTSLEIDNPPIPPLHTADLSPGSAEPPPDVPNPSVLAATFALEPASASLPTPAIEVQHHSLDEVVALPTEISIAIPSDSTSGLLPESDTLTAAMSVPLNDTFVQPEGSPAAFIEGEVLDFEGDHEYTSRDVPVLTSDGSSAEYSPVKVTPVQFPQFEVGADESAASIQTTPLDAQPSVPPILGPLKPTSPKHSLLPVHFSRKREPVATVQAERPASAERPSGKVAVAGIEQASRPSTARGSKAGSRQSSARKGLGRPPGTPMTVFTKEGLSFEDRRPGGTDSMRAVLASKTNRFDAPSAGPPPKGPELPSIDCRPPPSWFRKRYPVRPPASSRRPENFSVYSQPLPLTRAGSAPVHPVSQRHRLLRELRTRRDTALQEDYLGFPGVSPHAFSLHMAALQKGHRIGSPDCQSLAPTVNVTHPCHETFSLLGRIHWQEETKQLPRCHSPQYWNAKKHKHGESDLQRPSTSPSREMVPRLRQPKKVFPHQTRRVKESKYLIPAESENM